MKKNFDIKGIIAAANEFVRKEGATTNLAITLRNIQGKKQNIFPEEVQWVDETTLYEAFQSFVMPHCVSNMVNAVIAEYQELGYQRV